MDGKPLPVGPNSHDRNATWGYRAGGRAKGYKLHLLMALGGTVIAWRVAPMNRDEREMARRLFEPGEFIEVYVDTPLDVAEQRDPKGLYAKARRGELPRFTGIGSAYEPPESPELRLSTVDLSIEQAVDRILAVLDERDRRGA